MLRITLLAAAAGLAGCASTADMQAMRESPSYHQGYGDGCATGTEEDKSFSTKMTRDAYSFDNDPAYRTGWRQGYLECGDRTPRDNDGGRITGERNEF